MLEIRTSKRPSWGFIALSGLALAGMGYAAVFNGESSLLIPALVFGVGLAVGVRMLLRPLTLLKLEDSGITLYPGTLLRNVPLVSIPRKHLVDIVAMEESSAEGTDWLLRLTLTQPPALANRAARWAAYAKRHSRFEDDPDNVLVWPLPWPHLSITEINKWLHGYLSATATPAVST